MRFKCVVVGGGWELCGCLVDRDGGELLGLIFSPLHCLFLVDIFHEWALFSKANASMVK